MAAEMLKNTPLHRFVYAMPIITKFVLDQDEETMGSLYASL